MDGGPFKRHGPSSNSHVLTLFEDADAVEIDLFLLLPAVLEVGEPNLVQIVLEDMNRRVASTDCEHRSAPEEHTLRRPRHEARVDRLGAGEHGVNGKNQGHVSDTLNSWPAEYWGCGFAFKFTRYYGRDRSRCRGRGKGDRGSGKGGSMTKREGRAENTRKREGRKRGMGCPHVEQDIMRFARVARVVSTLSMKVKKKIVVAS